MIFQANGSNYDFAQSLRLLFSGGTTKDSDELRALLSARYGGPATLFSKGRGALSEAVRVSDAKTIAINGYTCSVVVEAVEAAGATAHYLDISPETAHFSAETLQKVAETTPGLGAVIVQNTYGIPCDIVGIETVARKHNLILIEDLAHSVGQTYADGRETGTVGDLVMVSFGRDKIIDVGSGGALIVRDQNLANRASMPAELVPKRLQRQDRVYPILSWLVRTLYPVKIGKFLLGAIFRFGWVARSSDGGIHRGYALPHWQARQAAKLLKRLDAEIKLRHEKTARYATLLNQPMAEHTSIRVPLRVDDQGLALARLRRNNFMLDDIWYDTPIGPQRKYADFAFPESDCPESVAYARSVINLPTHQFISPDDQVRLTKILQETPHV